MANQTDKTNTPDEVIDLVDKNDNIIGETTKGEANSNPKLFHREIGIIIYDDTRRAMPAGRQVLIQRRSLKKKNYPGAWAPSCAGHIPKGMSPLEAAHKELKEELGFDTELTFIYKGLFREPHETQFVYVYLGKYPDGVNIIPAPEEVIDTKFVTEKEYRAIPKDALTSYEHDTDILSFFKGDFDKYLSSNIS